MDCERKFTVDLLRFMNPSPYVVQHVSIQIFNFKYF